MEPHDRDVTNVLSENTWKLVPVRLGGYKDEHMVGEQQADSTP